MIAYMIEPDNQAITCAQANRDPVHFRPFGEWTLGTGGGKRVPEEWFQHWPSRAISSTGGRKPTAWILAAGYCVAPEVKAVIEALAPNVHQFVPLSLVSEENGTHVEHPYFSLHVADRADDVIVEQSAVNWREIRGAKYWTKRVDGPVALPASSIEGKQIWWNRKCNVLLISGELHDQLREKSLGSGLRFQKQIVVK